MSDQEESIYTEELTRLRSVFAASSDLIKARHWEEFEQASGGIKKLEKDLENVTIDLEAWYREGEN